MAQRSGLLEVPLEPGYYATVRSGAAAVAHALYALATTIIYAALAYHPASQDGSAGKAAPGACP